MSGRDELHDPEDRAAFERDVQRARNELVRYVLDAAASSPRARELHLDTEILGLIREAVAREVADKLPRAGDVARLVSDDLGRLLRENSVGAQEVAQLSAKLDALQRISSSRRGVSDDHLAQALEHIADRLDKLQAGAPDSPQPRQDEPLSTPKARNPYQPIHLGDRAAIESSDDDFDIEPIEGDEPDLRGAASVVAKDKSLALLGLSWPTSFSRQHVLVGALALGLAVLIFFAGRLSVPYSPPEQAVSSEMNAPPSADPPALDDSARRWLAFVSTSGRPAVSAVCPETSACDFASVAGPGASSDLKLKVLNLVLQRISARTACDPAPSVVLNPTGSTAAEQGRALTRFAACVATTRSDVMPANLLAGDVTDANLDLWIAWVLPPAEQS